MDELDKPTLASDDELIAACVGGRREKKHA